VAHPFNDHLRGYPHKLRDGSLGMAYGIGGEVFFNTGIVGYNHKIGSPQLILLLSPINTGLPRDWFFLFIKGSLFFDNLIDEMISNSVSM